MKNQNGFLLPIVMMFLLLLVMLTQQCFFLCQLQFKFQDQQWQREQLFFHAEQLLIQYENYLFQSSPDLLISKWNVHDDEIASETWWHEHGEIVKHEHFTDWIAVEKIADDPCLTFSKNKQGGSFYRISVRSTDNSYQDPLVLQTYDVLPADHLGPCLNPHPRFFSIGRVSWQQLQE